jgi:DNA-binding NtrC family response regulator
MNILFIEDEKALSETGVMQLEIHGHNVFPVYSISEAELILKDKSDPIHCVIADHHLADGLGIDFVIRAKATDPQREYAIVSGYLNDENIKRLEDHSILYFRKPLLYSRVLDQLRKAKMDRKSPQKNGAAAENASEISAKIASNGSDRSEAGLKKNGQPATKKARWLPILGKLLEK